MMKLISQLAIRNINMAGQCAAALDFRSHLISIWTKMADGSSMACHCKPN
jgi:hypothetical protein